MPTDTQRYSISTHVSESRPTKNFIDTFRNTVGGQPGDARAMYLYFRLPFPEGSTINSATLTLTNAYNSTLNTLRTIRVRRCDTRPNLSRLTFSNGPDGHFGAGESTVQLVTGVQSAGDTIEFDVSTILQTASDAGDDAWFGFIVTSDGDGREYYAASGYEGNESYLPTLTTEWEYAPEAPELLAPTGGRSVSVSKPTLRIAVGDVDDAPPLQAIQVQVDSSAARNFSAPSDSGWVETSVPEVDMDTAGMVGVANGASRGWRARYRDTVGVVSPWSKVGEFRRDNKGTLQIDQPSLGTGQLLEDPTPAVAVSIPGFSVRQYRLQVSYDDSPQDVLWRDTVSGGGSSTIPEGVLKRTDTDYRLRVFAWDTVSRQATPGDPVAYQAHATFRVAGAGDITAPSELIVVTNAVSPDATLYWRREARVSLLLDGGFENGGDGFEANSGSVTAAINAARFRQGTRSLRLAYRGTGEEHIFVCKTSLTSADVGGTLILSGWCWSSTATERRVRISGPPVTPETMSSGVQPGGQWVYVSMTREVLAAGEAVFSLFSDASQDVWWDSVKADISLDAPADSFVIFRDGEIVEQNVGTDDAEFSNGSYRFVDFGASPGRRVEWSVAAKVDNRISAPSAPAAATIQPVGIWLIGGSGAADRVLISGDAPGTFQQTEDSSVMRVLGSNEPVLVNQGLHGYSGSIEGTLDMWRDGSDYDGIPAAVWRTRMERMRRATTTPKRLVSGDFSINVMVYNVSVAPIERDRYAVSFEFFEVSE